MNGLLAFLVVLVVALSSVLYFVLQGSGAKEMLAKRTQLAYERERNDGLAKENMSLAEQRAFLRTELQKAGTGLEAVRGRIDELSKANDKLRKDCARLRMDLDYEKRRCDEYYGRVMELLAQQGQLGTNDNITG